VIKKFLKQKKKMVYGFAQNVIINTKKRRNKMIMFDIAEWIANLLVLGVAVVLWSIGIFIVAMLLSIAKKWIGEL